MAIHKISRESISDQVFDRMKELIREGEWKPGEKIPSENELAGQFGVSRVTVRNALQKLSALELLETRFGEGSFVRSPDSAAMLSPLVSAAYINDKGLEEILQLRSMIEGPVCREACRRADDAGMEELSAIFHKMQQAKDYLPEFARLDYEFHLKVAELAGNSIIIRIYGILNEVMENAFEQIVQKRGNRAGLYYHEKILEAFRAKDAQEAGRWMDEHMKDLYESYR